jgi:hypothetical protein
MVHEKWWGNPNLVREGTAVQHSKIQNRWFITKMLKIMCHRDNDLMPSSLN